MVEPQFGSLGACIEYTDVQRSMLVTSVLCFYYCFALIWMAGRHVRSFVCGGSRGGRRSLNEHDNLLLCLRQAINRPTFNIVFCSLSYMIDWTNSITSRHHSTIQTTIRTQQQKKWIFVYRQWRWLEYAWLLNERVIMKSNFAFVLYVEKTKHIL